MKKILTTLLVLSIGTLVFMGCSLIFGTTYSIGTDEGYCYEITTSEFSVILLLEAAGALEEPCDIEDLAASCTADSDEFNQEIVNYYSADYLAAYPELQDDCAADGGTWQTY